MLSISYGGSLSTATVNTDHTGNSPDVIVSGPSHGSLIEATARVPVQGGATYSGLNDIIQLLVLCKTTTVLKTVSMVWGRLPVDLSSFTASVNNRDINLNWSTLTESNNSGFDIERKAFIADSWTKVGIVTGNGTSNVAHDYTFCDKNLTSGIYSYRLKQKDFNGNFEYHNLNGEVVIGIPNSIQLFQNYPNPFNPSTSIGYDLPTSSFVSFEVYNSAGERVATLVNERQSPGHHDVSFVSSEIPSGLYLYRMTATNLSTGWSVSKSKKMLLVK